jgi:hypothetical protein
VPVNVLLVGMSAGGLLSEVGSTVPFDGAVVVVVVVLAIIRS